MNGLNEISFRNAAGRKSEDLPPDAQTRCHRPAGQAAPPIQAGAAAQSDLDATGISSIDLPRIERAIREMLLGLGEDPDRPGLVETPRRVAHAWRELLSGRDDDALRHLSRRFECASDEMVIVRDIDFTSICEHHLLPFVGRAHVAYLPGRGEVAGLSKIARTVDVFARRLQLQEQLTAQIADALDHHLAARGVCVLIEAEHSCMCMRGASKPRAVTATIATRGVHRTDSAARAQALSLMRARP